MTGCPVTGHHAPALPVVPHRGVPTVLDPALGAAVMLDPATWSPAGSMVAHRPLCPAALRVLARAGFALPPALANNDTPSHPVLRGAVAPLLAARRVRAWRPRIAALAQQGAEEALAAARRDGEVDLAVVGPGRVPLAVMTELLGIGEGLPHDLLARSAAPALELFWGEADDSRQVDLAGACAELYRAIRAELRRVRAAVPAVGGDGPGDGTGPWADAGAEADGLLGRLVRAGCDDRVAASAAFFTVVAGHETTRWLVAGAPGRSRSASARTGAWAGSWPAWRPRRSWRPPPGPSGRSSSGRPARGWTSSRSSRPAPCGSRPSRLGPEAVGRVPWTPTDPAPERRSPLIFLPEPRHR
ncbi:hypothetical protein ACFFHC_02930 [Kytococcus schroeteri]|uniref:hypothetical protein n=1 Tax=Kytococcus schroeteri TaxID=138300 RepID=UPI0035ED1FDA